MIQYYEEILLDDDNKRNNFFAKINRDTDDDDDMITTVPQIFINNVRIGGFNELFKFMQPTFDFKELHRVSVCSYANLNRVIDINFYPVEEI